eukprot:3755205-Amphidinium_carterae.1
MPTETHAASNLQQTLLHSSPTKVVKFGHPLPGRHYTRVALIARASVAWQWHTLEWLHTPCAEWYTAGRLAAWELWGTKGNLSAIFYVVYGHANARWSAEDKSLLHALLNDVQQDSLTGVLDILMRGDAPCVVGGDFNIQTSESSVLQQWQATVMCECRALGNMLARTANTSDRGTGSQIDHVWRNACVMSFDVNAPPSSVKGHHIVQVRLALEAVKERIYSLKARERERSYLYKLGKL